MGCETTCASIARAAHSISRVLPRPTSVGAGDADGAAEARHREFVALVLLLAIHIVVRARGDRLGTTRSEDGRCVAEALARSEAGRVVI